MGQFLTMYSSHLDFHLQCRRPTGNAYLPWPNVHFRKQRFGPRGCHGQKHLEGVRLCSEIKVRQIWKEAKTEKKNLDDVTILCPEIQKCHKQTAQF